MGSANQSITLNAEQVEALNRKFSVMRHDINNILSLITAAVDLMHSKPAMSERMIATVLEQPPRIINSISQFSIEFQRTLGIAGTDT